MHRANLTFSDEDWAKMVRHCKKIRPYQRVTTTIKEIALLNCTLKCSCVTDECSSVTTPSPTPAGAGTDPEKKEEKNKKEYIYVTQRAIKRINELRPSSYSFKPEPYQKAIQTLLRKRYTEADMITVAEWKANECKRKGDWQWFKPATLFRSESFGEKLDEAQAGVEIGGNGKPAQPDLWEAQKRKEQPHERRARERAEEQTRER